MRLIGLYYVSVRMNLCNSMGFKLSKLEMPLGFTTARCPLTVPLLSRPFMQT